MLTFAIVFACRRSAPEAPPAPAAPAPAAPAPAAPDAWVDEAVAQALEWEVMPGTSGGEEDAGRPAALRAFFQAHPEYADPARREALAAEACGLGGTEAAHAYLAKPPPKEPLIVEVDAQTWELFVAHADHHCTSDDWAWYSNETAAAAQARGAVGAYAEPKNDVVVVMRGGAEEARIPLTGQGFLVAKAGAAPKELGYEPTDGLLPELDAYLGAP